MTDDTGATADKLRGYLKRALAELDTVTRRLDEVRGRAREPIAIVGMGCRFPGGLDSPEAFWKFVAAGGDAIAEAPTDRGWASDPDVRLGGMLPDVADFDADFFGISPREALAMDPQQRLMLEVSWDALERSGYNPESLRGSDTGVFTGVGAADYGPRPDESPDEVRGYVGTGTASSVVSGRVAYTLGLRGPAVSVDTACSSGLTAVHLAMESLRRDECGLALAGGVTVMSSPGAFTEFRSQGGLAADGRCKPFAEAADGFGLAEGAGVLVLQRLSVAQAAGRRVLAVLPGSAINQDGASNGLTAPSGPAQQRVIRQALTAAGIDPGDVDHVEAHGTGTRLGDPIEAHALLRTYGDGRDPGRPLWIGSVKSNIGHTQAAAGVAGVMKTVLAMRHGELPASLHLDEPSRQIDWGLGGVSVLSGNRPWPAGGRVRRAGVSAFGISGTNAHVVVEEAPAMVERGDAPPDGPVPLVLSGRTPSALRAQAHGLAEHLDADPGLALADAGLTLATRRGRWEHRAVVVGDRATALVGLRAVAAGTPGDHALVGRARPSGGIVMVFPGQGAQWPGMAAELLCESPVFAESIQRCEAALAPHVDWSLTGILRDGAPLDRVDVVQPALFAVMVSLAALWRSFGVEPAAVVGHSQGEIAAAYVAGALSLDDAAMLVAVRSRLLRGISGRGGMVSVASTAADVARRIEPFAGAVSLASVNGPRSVVVSGAPEPLERLIAACDADGIPTRRVPVDYASHSPQVESLRDGLLSELGGVRPVTSAIPLYSTTTGRLVDTAGMGAAHWYANLRGTVRFADATRQLAEDGFDTFVEVSPHRVLTAAIEATVDEVRPEGAVVVGTLRRDHGGRAELLTALAEASVRGVEVDWAPAFDGARVVELPGYAFQRTRFWLPVPGGGRGEDAWRHQLVWRAVATPDPVASDARVLLVTTGDGPDGWARAIGAGLVDAGATVVPLACTERTRAGIGAALADAPVPSLVVALPAVGGEPDGPASATLALAQALADAGIDAPLWTVTRGAVAVAGDDGPVDPAQAMAAGVGRVVGVERPDRWGGQIDLREAGPETVRALAAVLARPREEDQVAIRAGAVRVARLVPVSAPRTGWTPRGTVLITGGTGGIGAHVARLLARSGVRHLILLSRRGAEAPGVAELRAELVASGAGVTVAACDVADRDRLAAVLDAERAEGRTVDAVLHAAGTSRSTPFEELTEREFAEVGAAKVRGTLNLDELCPDLDAFVLFSSNAGIWGGPGLTAYAAANAFLDGFARRRRAEGAPVTSVAWGLWAGATMAGDEGGAYLRSQGMRAMDPERAVGALAEVLGGGSACWSVVDADWPVFVELFTASWRRPLFDELPGAVRHGAGAGRHADGDADAPDLARRLSPLPAAERHEHLARIVRAEVAAALGHAEDAPIDRDRAFRDIGFDSLTAVDLRNRLASATGIREAATVVFDHPTVTRLAEHYLAMVLGDAPEPEQPRARAAAGDVDEPIAIVGMACRLANGVNNPDELWDYIVAGGDAVGPIPEDRGWDLDALFDSAPGSRGTSATRRGAFLDGAADFDAAFFGISPREALAMDPQQRQVLETTWELLENAGIDPLSLAGSATGVFLGAAYQGYGQDADIPEDSEGYMLTGNSSAVVSGRVSYVLGLEGPAVTVDTACSSSLVALHQACGSLRDGDCDLAVAGGVSVMAGPEVFREFSRQGALAPDGRCKPYSAQADGFGFAEGVAMVLLQPLSVARSLGRRVLGVVAGSAVNQDGASNGLSAPSGVAQGRVIRRAWGRAGVSGVDVGVVEGHGTGTRLGDPVEVSGVVGSYGVERAGAGVGPVSLGSLKGNVGHTQAAAGVAGVVKTVLGLGRGLVGPSVCTGGASGLVEWRGVEVAEEVREWLPGGDGVRRAGVSAFGVSGTNAHVIIAEAPEPEPEPEPGPLAVGGGSAAPVPVLLSARTATGLAAVADRLGSALDDAVPLSTLAFSLATRRAHLPHRAALLARDHGHLRDLLRAVAAGIPAPGVLTGAPVAAGAGAVFVFPGQGSQWTGMAADLLASSPVFAARLAECSTALGPFVDFSVEAVLRRAPGAPSLDRVDVVQPVLFSVLVALSAVWRSCGVEPAAVIGHSQGEIAAAVVAGALSVDDGARVVAHRAAALCTLAGEGGMLSLAVPGDRARALIAPWDGRVCVAAVNSPASVVVSGDPDALAGLEDRCRDEGVRAKRLPVDYASHSAHVDRIRDAVLAGLGAITPRRAQVPLYSTLHGRRSTGEDMDAGYWFDNLRRPVRFADAVAAAAADGHRVFVESSPHPVLAAAVAETVPDATTLGSLHRDTGAGHLMGELAAAHVGGVAVDWTAVLPPAPPVPLPNYPFESRRFWLPPRATVRASGIRYRIDWTPLPLRETRLSGTYLLAGAVPAALAGAIEAAGGRVADAGTERPDDVTAVVGAVPDHAAALALHQGLGRTAPDVPLWLVTHRAVGTGEHDRVDPVQAMIWGIGRVMGLEAPQRWGGMVDLPVDPAPADLAAAVAVLGADDHEDQVAVRDGRRLGRRLVRAPLDAAGTWAPAGTVLITGGTGALGAHVARHLAAGGAEDLVLISRSGPAAAGGAALEQELVALGAKVTVTACDVTDRARLAELVDGLRTQGRAVRTVVHAAGVAQSRPLSDTDPAELDAVCAPKVTGARLLDELCPDLDAFVLFSSGAGVWGSANLGAYAAANACLDALAQRRRTEGQAATAVAWGAWAGDGMATGDIEGLTRRGVRPLDTARAVRALEHAVAAGDVCVTVADVDWSRFAVGFTAARPRPLLDALVDPAPVGVPVPSGPAPARSPAELLELTHAHVAAALGHSGPADVGPDQPLGELGFDSLSAVGLRNRLQQATALTLPASLVFGQPTVRALAAHLGDLLGAEGPRAPTPGTTLRAGYRRSAEQGRVQSYIDLLAGLSDFREHFDDATGLDRPVALLPLAGDRGPVAVICCAGTAPVAGPHEFVRLAGALRDTAPVFALPQPGYEGGEPLPSSLDAVLGAQADAVLAARGDEPFVLAGHSAGAMMAWALATELTERGHPPRGVVLLDVYPPERQQAVRAWLADLTERMFDHEPVPMDDTRLTALGAYDRLMRGWRPRAIGVPTLLVRATDPVGPWPDDGWVSTWPFEHEVVTVPGDHFSMVQEHTDALARAIIDWLVGVPR